MCIYITQDTDNSAVQVWGEVESAAETVNGWGKGTFLKLSIIKINEKRGPAKMATSNRRLSALASSLGFTGTILHNQLGKTRETADWTYFH